MYRKTGSNVFKRLCAVLLALSMVLPLVPVLDVPAQADYSDSAIDQLLNWGVMAGYPDGKTHPERKLTRAEFVAMVNRAYGYTETGRTPFTDVPDGAWFYDDIGIAYTAKYFSGMSPRMAMPDRSLTREQAAVMLARNMRLDPVDGEVIEFTDGRDFSVWSSAYARAAAQAGFIGGYQNGTFLPQREITRGEMAVMLVRALGTLINRPGVHTLSDVYGNVTINTPNTTLRDTTIAGDLYITGGLGLGDIRLENVRVLGKIVIAGGGESQEGESVALCNVEADSLKIDSMADQYVSLRAEGNTVIGETVVRSDSYILDRTRPGDGLLNIILESPDNRGQFTLSGNLENVVNKTPNSLLTIAMGTVENLTVDEAAKNSRLYLDVGSTVVTLNLDTATNVSGVGDIQNLFVNAPGCDVEMLPDKITIRPGLIAVIGGESMNAEEAKESSADPRLLAGYPKLRNIAPTSAAAVFSANKSGTVYWAVSLATDGSIGEDELVLPTTGNTRIKLNGTTAITSSNTEFTTDLEKLEPDCNYYLSTVMVDARGRRSPVKVASFTTPDDTEPAFTTGFPVISQNDFYYKLDKDGRYELDEEGNRIPIFRAQVSGMPNKNCQVYFALYYAGSAEPTGQQFRTGALGKVLQSGVEDINKNEVWRKTFKGLEELTDYDLYLWLSDADGARSSKIYKLTFKTTDGTPPKFQYDTPNVSGNPPATSIPTRANMDEDCTVYWVVVKHGDDYIRAQGLPKDVSDLPDIIDYLKGMSNGKWKDVVATQEEMATYSKILDTFKRKIEAGSGSIRNGNVRARMDTDTAINVTGLTAESAYDIYYVAKDAAGNYSDVKVITERTLDVTPPTVTQEFTLTNEKGQPYADTGINLIFSEDIQLYRSATENTPENSVTLSSFANIKDDEERRTQMAEFLAKIIVFYNDSSENPNQPIETRRYKKDADGKIIYDEETGKPTPYDENWTLDFRKAEITQDPDTGTVTVYLPSRSEDGVPVGALNLNSDTTYHFVIRDVQDLATTPNRIRPMPFPLDPFHTIAAQVQLRKDVSDATITSLYEEAVQTAVKDKYGNATDMAYHPALDKIDRGDVSKADVIVNNNYKYVFVDDDGTEYATDDPLAIDMSFSLRPVSVSVNQDMRWDMVFWSNTAVEFEVYRRERGVDTWEKLTSTGRSRIQPDASNEFAGKGLTYLRQRAEQPYVRPEMTDKIASYDPLDPNKVYEYAIHFTKVGNVREYVKELDSDGKAVWSTLNGREIWDVNIEFRINVITGMGTAPFSELSNGAIYYNQYNTMLTTLGAQEINTTDVGSDYFTLYHPFAIQRAPVFTNGNPIFTTEDIGATINVTTDRAGTVYWVVAPFQRQNATTLNYEAVLPPQIIGSTISADTASVEGVNRFAAYVRPTNAGDDFKIEDHLVPYRGNEDINNLCLVDRPYPDEIYNPSLTSDRMRAGSIPVTGSGMVTISVPDLDPGTGYFAYFVLQSEGRPIYSEKTYLFQFWTEEVSRPKLIIEGQGNATVQVKSKNMDARANYAVFLMTGLPDELEWPFYSREVFGSKYGDTNIEAQLDKINPEIRAGKGSSTEGSSSTPFRVYDALETLRDGGTIYDEYASEAHKDALLKLITNQTYSPGFIDQSNANLTMDTWDLVNCQEKYKIQEGQNYLFIAAAVSPRAQQNQGPDSYGFAVKQPIFVSDPTPPKINSYDGFAYVNFKDDAWTVGIFNGEDDSYDKVKKNRMSGRFDLTFDKDLYIYKDEKTRRAFLESSKGNVPTYDANANAIYSDFGTSNNLPDFDVIAVMRSGSSNVRTVRLLFDNLDVSKSSTFSANVNLSSYYSSPNTKDQLKLTLHYDAESMTVIVTASSATWYEQLTMDLPTQVNEADPPPAAGLIVTPSSLTLSVGESRTLRATLQPTGAVGEIYWEAASDDGGSVEISPNPSSEVTVIGSSAGTVTVTAYVLDSDGNHKPKGTCQITVNSASVKINGSETGLTLAVNGTQQLSLTITPPTAVVVSYTWTSSNPFIASVTTQIGDDMGGLVTGNSTGETVITVEVRFADGSTRYASISVTVE